MPGVPTLLWQESPDPELQGYGVGKVVRGDPGPTQGAVEFLLMCRMGLGMLDSSCPTSSRDAWPDGCQSPERHAGQWDRHMGGQQGWA